jgi:hypothetical protein
VDREGGKVSNKLASTGENGLKNSFFSMAIIPTAERHLRNRLKSAVGIESGNGGETAATGTLAFWAPSF